MLIVLIYVRMRVTKNNDRIARRGEETNKNVNKRSIFIIHMNLFFIVKERSLDWIGS